MKVIRRSWTVLTLNPCHDKVPLRPCGHLHCAYNPGLRCKRRAQDERVISCTLDTDGFNTETACAAKQQVPMSSWIVRTNVCLRGDLI